MGSHAGQVHFLHLQFDVGVDPLVGEHAATGQELAVCVQCGQGFIQRGAHGRDQFVFFRWQVVQVLVCSIAWVDLVLDTIQTGHQQGGEAQIRVSQRVREACLDTAAFRVRYVRDTDGSGTVFGGVGQFYRCFVVRYQTLVGVGARVGDGVQCLGVLDDTADVVQGGVGQAGVAVTSKQVFAVFPDGLVYVHAGAVVANDRFWHEGSGFAVAVGDVVYHVLQDLGPVSALGQGAELGADFVLASGGHFVVVYFYRYAQFFQQQHHGRADVLGGIYRWYREVAAFYARTVAGVAAFELFSGSPGSFFCLDLHEAAGHVGAPGDAVEDEEFWLRAKVCSVTNAGSFQVGFGALGYRAWAAVVAFAVGRVDHVTAHEYGRLVEERVDLGGGRVGHQQHVGGLDAFPAGDGGAVKRVAALEPLVGIFQQNVCRDGHVLFFTHCVGKAQVDKFYVVFGNELDYVCNRHGYLLEKS